MNLGRSEGGLCHSRRVVHRYFFTMLGDLDSGSGQEVGRVVVSGAESWGKT